VLTSTNYASFGNLLNATGNFTLFAPQNSASLWGSINTSDVPFVSAVLLYHVGSGYFPSSTFSTTASNILPTSLGNGAYSNTNANAVVNVYNNGGSFFVSWGYPGTANFNAVTSTGIQTANIACTNGLIHVINQVLTPPATLTQSLVKQNCYSAVSCFTNTISAVTTAGVASTLDTTAAITVFLPNSAAFSNVNWQALPVPALVNVLTYHVVAGVVYSKSVSNGLVATTLNTQSINFTVTGSGVQINGVTNQANILAVDNLIQNGVYHIIDTVLIPNAVTPSPTSSPVTMSPTTISTNTPTMMPNSGVMSSPQIALIASLLAVVFLLF